MDGKEINKFHALQLFTDTFAAETVHLTNEEVGIYIRLLCFAWTKNAKPFTTQSAYRICQCQSKECEGNVYKILDEFFKLESFLKNIEKWTHKRLTAEHEYLTAKYKKRSESGRKGGLARSKNVAPIPIPSPIPNKYIYDAGFEKLWNLVNKPRGSKKKAEEIFGKVLKFIDIPLEDVAEIYNTQIDGIETKFVPHFTTWLSQHRWENNDFAQETVSIIKKMENLGYIHIDTKPRFNYFKKDGKEYRIDRYDKNHIIHEINEGDFKNI